MRFYWSCSNFQNWVVNFCACYFCRGTIHWLTLLNKLLLAIYSSIGSTVLLAHLHLQWRSAGLTFCEKSCIFKVTPPLTLQLCLYSSVREEISTTDSCVPFINFVRSSLQTPLPLFLPSSPSLLNLSYFNACLIQCCHLSHAVSLITVFLSCTRN